jgi:hypothetical protein
MTMLIVSLALSRSTAGCRLAAATPAVLTTRRGTR